MPLSDVYQPNLGSLCETEYQLVRWQAYDAEWDAPLSRFSLVRRGQTIPGSAEPMPAAPREPSQARREGGLLQRLLDRAS